MTETVGETTPAKNGALWASLKRNFKEIKEGRALSILEDAEISYKREIENRDRVIVKLTRKMEDDLDFSPDNTTSLTIKNYNSDLFVQEDLVNVFELRNKKIQLNECKKRYNQLFGKTYELEEI